MGDDDSSFTRTAPAEDLSVCDRCFGDPDIQQFVKDSADSFLCDFCGRRGRTRVVAAPLVEVVEFIISSVEREYERAVNALGYESAEGGYLGAHWNSEELIDGKRQSNPEVVLISWVACQAEGVRWSSWVAGKLAS